MNKILYRIISFLLIIVWMFAIFHLSAMDGKSSDSGSRKVVGKIVSETRKDYTKEQVNAIVYRANTPFRKCMHASEYFVLALLLFNFINTFSVKKYYKYIGSLLIAFLYACTDEFHQTFVFGRGGQFKDVVIDTSGALLGLIVLALIIQLFKKIKLKNAKQKG